MAFGLDDAVAAGLKIIDKFIPDPEAKLKAQSEWLKMDHDERAEALGFDRASMDGQNQINLEEAKSDSIWKSGWRPFIGWVCGSAFALHFLLLPIVNFIIVARGGTEVTLEFDMASLMSVLMGMLGLGGMRSYEKVKQWQITRSAK